MVRRRKFSDEYKREAVRLATQLGVTKSQVAQELGINANLLGRWGRRLRIAIYARPFYAAKRLRSGAVVS